MAKGLSDRVTGLSDSKQELLRRFLGREASGANLLPIRKVDATSDTQPLSRAQESMYFLSHLAGSGGVYNLPAAVRLRGPLDIEALQAAFTELIRRHEGLRSAFPATAGKPQQRVFPPFVPDLVLEDLSTVPADEVEQRVRELARQASEQAFDLANPPLIRFYLYRLADQHHVLLLVVHHLIWDGWSIGVFTTEMAALYEAFGEGRASPLAEAEFQFRDFVRWEREGLTDEALDEQTRWWRRQLAGVDVLELPTDRPRPPVQSFAGAMQFLELPASLTESLHTLGSRYKATPFMVLSAAFGALLGRYSGQQHFCLGTPIANRLRKEFEGVVGYFANVLVLPVDLREDPSFAELVERVRTTTLAGYGHQDIPFESLVDRLGVERDPSRNPLFGVMVALHAESLDDLELSNLSMGSFGLEGSTTHFDLGLHLWRRGQVLRGYFSYSTALFDESTIARMTGHLFALLEAAAADPATTVSRLPLLHPKEAAWLDQLCEEPLPSRPTPHPLIGFERWARDEGERVALRWAELPDQDAGITYAELYERAQSAAHFINELGESAPLGMYMQAGRTHVALILGAMLAGVPLVELDPSWSDDQRARVINDAGVQLVLTGPRSPKSAANTQVVPVDWSDLQPKGQARRFDPGAVNPEETTAYTSYASGQAVAVSHAQLAERIAVLQTNLGLSKDQGLVAQTPPTMQFRVLQLLWPLSRGASSTLTQPGTPLPQDAVATWIHLTPRALQSLTKQGADHTRGVHGVLCSGGYLGPESIQAFMRVHRCEFRYLYSPPELPFEAGMQVGRAGSTRSAAGGVRAWVRGMRVCDGHGTSMPIGVPGRIHLADTPLPDQGRRLEDGSIEVLGPAPGEHSDWVDGYRLDFRQLEARLSALPQIAEARLTRPTRQGDSAYPCYVVPTRDGDRPSLKRALLRNAGLPELEVIPISRAPLDICGDFDAGRLSSLACINDDLLDAWTAAVKGLPGVADARALELDAISEAPRIHLFDVLPERHNVRDLEQHTTISTGLAGENQPQQFSDRMAYADGGPLQLPAGAPTTLSEALRRVAAGPMANERGLTIYEGSSTQALTMSYAQLLKEAEALLAGLQGAGLGPGDRVILQLSTLADHFASFWACVLGGITPVTVANAPVYERKNAVLNKLWNIWLLLERPPLVTSSALADSLTTAGELYQKDAGFEHGFELLDVDELKKSSGRPEPYECQAQDVVFLQLTSGSTGVPKCIQETHHGIIHHIHGSAIFNDYTADDVDLNWLPMDHVVPILTCHLKDTYMGIRQVHVRTEQVLVEPLRWLDLIEQHRATHTWAPNFGFKLVNDALARPEAETRSWDLSSMRFFMNAGEQVTQPVCAEFVERLAPFGIASQTMQPAFGMAEVCTCMTYANDFVSESCGIHVAKSSLGGALEKVSGDQGNSIHFIDLGPPMPGVEIRIADGRGKTLPELVIGLFQIRGAVTTPGYLNNPEANAEAFVGEGWFNTGDLGYMHDGRLTITGRMKEMIIVRGANLYCYEIEAVINETEGVLPTFAAACSVDDPATGTEGLAVFYVATEPSLDVDLLRRVRTNVTREFGVSPSYVVPLPDRESFPKTTSGKIQRTRLKKRLAEGGFDALLRDIDLATAAPNTLPAWFHHRVWRPRTAQDPVLPWGFGSTLFLLGPADEGLEVVKNWDPSSIFVRQGAGFQRQGPRSFCIDPKAPDDYRQLVQTLRDEGHTLRSVLHLMGYDNAYKEPGSQQDLEQAQALGADSFFFSAQALAEFFDHPITLLAVTKNGQRAGDDPGLSLGSGGLGGLVSTLAQEWPQLRCRVVDLPAHDDSLDAELLQRELHTVDGEPLVAYRHGERLVPRLDRVDHAKTRTGLLKKGQLLVISGGLGGVGEALAGYLLRTYNSRLLLLGRSHLDEDSAKHKHAAFENLSAQGDVLYRSVDICDQEAVRAAMDEAQTHWGAPIAGAFHLAGSFPMRPAADETPNSLAAVMRPKTSGAWVLDQVLDEPAFLVAFGSVYGLLGGVATAAYSAANSALETVCEAARAKGRKNSIYLAWSNWDELGMSRGYALREQSKALGMSMIDARRGIDSLEVALRTSHPSLTIGLDATRPNVRRRTLGPAEALHRLAVAYVLEPGAPPPVELHSLMLPDHKGRPSTCALIRVEQLPQDNQVFGALRRAKVNKTLPSNELEKTVAAVWCDVLKVEEVDIDATFFELGGQSIQLVQVVSRLSKKLGQALSVVDFFRRPTVRSLAAHLAEGGDKKADFGKASERATRQRQARKRRARPPTRRRR